MARLPAIVALALLLLPAAASAQPGDVPPGKTLVVIGQSGAERADALGAGTATRPAGAMWYVNLFDAEDVATQVAAIRTAVAQRPGLVVNLGISFGAISTPSPPYTAAIAAGAYDANIATLAGALNGLRTVAYLRIGYEFDLLGGQYGPPELYKAAYRHVVDELRGHGVDNANYVWHSSGAFWRATDPSLFAQSSGTLATALRDLPADIDPQPIAAFFPGDDYVDAFGISFWQDSCCFGRSSEQARRVYEERTRELLTQAQGMGLPLHVSEATPAYVGADSGRSSVAWLDTTFRLIEDFDIRMLSLIAIDWREGGFFAAPFWNGYWPDARVHAFADTCARYVAAVTDRRYVHRSRKLGRRLAARSRRIPAGPRPGDAACAGAQP